MTFTMFIKVSANVGEIQKAKLLLLLEEEIVCQTHGLSEKKRGK